MYRSAEFLSAEIPVHHCVESTSDVTVNNFDLPTESILSIPTEEKISINRAFSLITGIHRVQCFNLVENVPRIIQCYIGKLRFCLTSVKHALEIVGANS